MSDWNEVAPGVFEATVEPQVVNDVRIREIIKGSNAASEKTLERYIEIANGSSITTTEDLERLLRWVEEAIETFKEEGRPTRADLGETALKPFRKMVK